MPQESEIVEAPIALVTGAGSGIGRASAQCLASAGARVVVSDVDDAGGRETVATIESNGGKAVFVRADVTSPDEVDALFGEILAAYGRLDWAHNNAGIAGSLDQTVDYTLDEWTRVMTVNVTGVFLCVRAELAIMLRQGSGAIVNTASECSIKGSGASTAYVASKHAVHGLTKAVALETAAAGIRINAVAPGAILTPMMQGAPPDVLGYMEKAMPVERFGDPSEVAEGVLWLLSPASSLVNGHMLVIDGGWAGA